MAQVVEKPSGTGSMEELILIMFILVIAGFRAGWIVKNCVIMFFLSFMNRASHQLEVSQAEEEPEESQKKPMKTFVDQENCEATLLNVNNQLKLYVKYLYRKEKLENTMDGKNG